VGKRFNDAQERRQVGKKVRGATYSPEPAQRPFTVFMFGRDSGRRMPTAAAVPRARGRQDCTGV